jgi:HD-like signal output (HDOD) protein
MRLSDLKLRFFAKMADKCLKSGKEIPDCTNEVVQELQDTIEKTKIDISIL